MSDARPDMTFQQFSSMNRTRCEAADGFHHALGSWSTSDWFLAVLGELGEAANVAKKLNRVRDGIPGNTEEPDVLRAKLRQELGDAFVYLDLLAQSLDCFIGEAAMEVFTAKSIQIGYQSGAGVAAGAARPPTEEIALNSAENLLAYCLAEDSRTEHAQGPNFALSHAATVAAYLRAASRPRPQEGQQRMSEAEAQSWDDLRADGGLPEARVQTLNVPSLNLPQSNYARRLLFDGHPDRDCEVVRGVGWMCTCQTAAEKADEAAHRAECEAEQDAASLAASPPQQEPDALTVIEQELDRLNKAAFGVDVRERVKSQWPCFESVVSLSDAMHALLFVRKALRAGRSRPGAAEEPT